MSKRQTGRPPLYDTPVTARLSLAVTPAQRLELKRIATDNGTGMSNILREAMNEFVSDYGERHPFRPKKR